MKKAAIFILNSYQKAVSPWMGSCCRFHPSCSQYAKEAIQKEGAIKGSWLAVKRLLKCQPLHPGGWDPVESRA